MFERSPAMAGLRRSFMEKAIMNPQLTEIRVRGYHLDVYGHVNNARYLEFLEEARWHFFETSGALQRFMDSGLAFVVVNINISYRRPALLNESLVLHTSVKTINRRSGVLHQVIHLKDTEIVVADADVTFCLYDPKQDRSIAIEGEILQLLEQMAAL